MNIILNITDILLEYIYFLDKKINVIFNGFFTKIIYSNELFSMKGIYLNFPLEIIQNNDKPNKHYICFNVYNRNNIKLIQDLTMFENILLEHYKLMNNCNKKINNVLSKQLFSGSLKIFQENYFHPPLRENKRFILKISGIWETKEKIGINYKIYNI